MIIKERLYVISEYGIIYLYYIAVNQEPRSKSAGYLSFAAFVKCLHK